MDFVAPNGESWMEVRARAIEHFSSLEKNKTHLVFTHGGLVTSYLYDLGVTEMPPNCSFVGVTLEEGDSGLPASVDFEWNFPYIEEDI